MTTRILTIGYGNPLRGDDGFGWHAGTQLARGGRPPGSTVLVRHQLTPELAADVAQAGLVVLIDARQADGPTGEIVTRRINPSPAQAHPWSHYLWPQALLELSATLYEAAPPMFLITVSGASFDHSEGLSPVLQRVLPEVVRLVRRVWSTAEDLAGTRPAGFSTAYPRSRGVGPRRTGHEPLHPAATPAHPVSVEAESKCRSPGDPHA